MEQVTIKKNKSSLFLVWLIPIIALFIAGWALYKHFDERGVDIVVVFDSAEGFTEGKTKLRYKGIDIGTVTKISIGRNSLDKVELTINIKGEPKYLVPRSGSRFWKVSPNITLDGISGLDTIISGSYIAAMTDGNSVDEILEQDKQFRFEALPYPPPDALNNGLLIKLAAKNGEIGVGAPIYYLKFQIGKIVDYELKDDGILYTALIEHKYKYLLKKESKFWKINAIDVKASFSNVELEVASLSSLFSGGIAMSSPEGAINEEKDSLYVLFNKEEESRLLKSKITLKSKSGYNLTPGISYVYHKGIKAGEVESVDLDPLSGEATIEIRLLEEFEYIAKKGAYYWAVEPEFSLDGIKNVGALLSGTYIAFSSDSDQKECGELHDTPPKAKGIKIALKAKEVGSLKEGSGVYYDNISVGSVDSIVFMGQNKDSIVNIVVFEEYKRLVNDSSLFYAGSGMTFKASVDEIYFKSGTLADMMRGGVFFSTQNPKAKLTKNSFALFGDYDSYRKAEYLSGGGKRAVLFSDKMPSVTEGSRVFYKTLSVGEIIGYVYDPKKDKMKIDVYIEPEYSSIVGEDTVFYDISGVNLGIGAKGLELNTASISSIVKGGIGFENTGGKKGLYKEGGYKLFGSRDEALEELFEVALYIDSAASLDVGAKVRYKGFDIGSVKSKKLEEGKALLALAMKEEYRDLIKKDTLFWVEGFEAGLAGVKNPSSAVFGDYIALLPGVSKEESELFYALSTSPSPRLYENGLRIVLKGGRKSSLDSGSPIYYRQVQIGEIIEAKLAKDSASVEFLVFIEPCFAYLVRENSIFYNATALGFDVSLFGVKVETETLETMIKGGITMVIPESPAKRAGTLSVFELYDEGESSWLRWSPILINEDEGCK